MRCSHSRFPQRQTLGFVALLLLFGLSLGHPQSTTDSSPPPPLQLEIRLGHSKGVTALAFSPDRKTLVTGNEEGTLRFWEAPTGQLLRTLIVSSDPVRALAFSPDGRTVAVGGTKPSVQLWDAETGKPQKGFPEADQQVQAVAFSPDGQLLACGSATATVTLQVDRFVNFRRGEEVFPVECYQAHAYRPDLVRQVLAGQEVASLTGPQGPSLPSVRFVAPTDGSRVHGDTVVETFSAANRAPERVSAVIIDPATGKVLTEVRE